ncbi:DUF1501 domain-containing protein [Inhella proteolytica]|uniref:DUF1501 domain-containing protein n=1 Tax=Inhella proteolytica TaxID=2795029 RepID=A0A931J6M0_9BURK|nr:DUF1501 domain-containing protein [Inhella proteolytica]MBH9579221.1 DUF1501 domain-containing protein [Inhella proteolytica]
MTSCNASRRAFLRHAGRFALAGTAAPLALNLAALGEAAAFTASDYKALVCVFLYGGMDHANTLVHADATRHAQYAAIRRGLAVPLNQLDATRLQPAQALPEGQAFALHPAMPELSALFNQGKAGVLFNVGPLIAPLTKAQFNSGDTLRYPVPPKLFSHNDHASIWQSSDVEGSVSGWGGRLGDLALAGNGSSVFTCISAAGQAVFVSGQSAVGYQVTHEGPVALRPFQNGVLGSQAMVPFLRELITQARGHELEAAYNQVMARSITAGTQLSAALAPVPVQPGFPAGNSLADQLQIVVRIMAARQSLGVKRQVFMVALPGFDHHDGLLGAHPALVGTLSKALQAFYSATESLGLASQVTTFTASDFGRALSSNGDGTDHGWGGHHFVLGGAVKGQAFYGTPPPPSVGESTAPEDQWHVGNGRLLPTSSVDQFGATLGRWFGASESELRTVFPNLHNFGGSLGAQAYPIDLGFMR